MMKYLKKNLSDDSNFINNLECIISNSLNEWKCEDLYLIRIDNWFDKKWLFFQGTVMHEIALWTWDELIVPPFHPNRVESIDYYEKQNDSYVKKECKGFVHPYQSSIDNLKRKVKDISQDGLFVWYSSNSKTNQKGVIMSYLISANSNLGYHITLDEKQNWNVAETKGINKKQVQSLIIKS